MELKFVSNSHKQFYFSCLAMCKRKDPEHRALIYALGLNEESRLHIDDVFSFDKDQIIPEGLYASWQTEDTSAFTRLAFNLWNGYHDDKTTPLDLYTGSYCGYLIMATQLRFDESIRNMDIIRSFLGED